MKNERQEYYLQKVYEAAAEAMNSELVESGIAELAAGLYRMNPTFTDADWKRLSDGILPMLLAILADKDPEYRQCLAQVM